MPELAVSTWSLHRELGPMYREPAAPGGARHADNAFGAGRISLLEVPARVAAAGIHNLEICHFHFPRTDDEYLDELKKCLQQANVRLTTLLIDSGDITAPDPERRAKDLEWMKGWIDVAARLGAMRVRVIAGHAEPDEEGQAMKRSLDGLGELTDYAAERGVGVITENWYALTMQPANLLTILDSLEGRVGLCADFGNYGGPGKYHALEAILPRADSIHAKADYPEAGRVNREDFTRCLNLARSAGFGGTYVLIFDGPGEEWNSLAEMSAIVQPYL